MSHNDNVIAHYSNMLAIANHELIVAKATIDELEERIKNLEAEEVNE